MPWLNLVVVLVFRRGLEAERPRYDWASRAEPWSLSAIELAAVCHRRKEERWRGRRRSLVVTQGCYGTGLIAGEVTGGEWTAVPVSASRLGGAIRRSDRVRIFTHGRGRTGEFFSLFLKNNDREVGLGTLGDDLTPVTTFCFEFKAGPKGLWSKNMHAVSFLKKIFSKLISMLFSNRSRPFLYLQFCLTTLREERIYGCAACMCASWG